MKSPAAVLFSAPGKLDVIDIDVAPPHEGEVLVEMAAGGVCHSDLHVMRGELIAPTPAVLGHEGAGIVADVGAGVKSVKQGDHVIPLWRLSCGDCEYCTRGRPALCLAGTRVRNTGLMLDGTSRFSFDGKPIKTYAGVSTFSRYTVVPEKALLKIDNDLPLTIAALLGCAVVTGFGAVANAAKVMPGNTVAVFGGAGGVGLNVVQSAALAGAASVIAVDRHASKLAAALHFGATHTVDVSRLDAPQTIRELTNGRGVDFAFDVVGAPVATRQAYDSLTRMGTLIAIGLSPESLDASIPMKSLVYEERKIIGSLYGSGSAREEIPRLASLYRAGKLKLDELLTRTYPLSQINQAYDALERGEVLRSVVTYQ